MALVTVRLARAAECAATGDAVSSIAQLEGPEYGHFPLATPVLHPWAWGDPDAPAERLTGLSTDEIWSVQQGERLLVLKSDSVPVGAVLDDDAASALGSTAELANGGAAIAALLSLKAPGRAHPSDLLLSALVIPPGELWVDAAPSMRDLYLYAFDNSMRTAHCLANHAPVMVTRHALADLGRAIHHLFSNGDRGLSTTRGFERCTSLRDMIERHLPGFDSKAVMAGGSVTLDGVSSDQQAVLRAAGLWIES